MFPADDLVSGLVHVGKEVMCSLPWIYVVIVVVLHIH